MERAEGEGGDARSSEKGAECSAAPAAAPAARDPRAGEHTKGYLSATYA